jgi:cohesin loading factor subunit SCC2
MTANDTSLKFAKFYLVGQWLKELNQREQDARAASNNTDAEYGQERIERHAALEAARKQIYSLIENAANMTIHSTPTLAKDEAFILSKYLASLKKTLDKNFDVYLVSILNLSGAGSDSNNAPVPTQVRSKAIKCLSLIVEADPQILLKPKVFSCVQANFMHQTISVREASVDLIGRFITIKPDLTNQYYKLLSDRVLDVGVSVRKRVIKVFRDVCINQPKFEHLVEICVKILRRINDEDAIKKLVIDHFYSIWFAPLNNKDTELIKQRVLNIVDVVSELNVLTNNASFEIFEQLFNSLLHVTANNPVVKDERSTPNAGATPNTTEQENQLARANHVLKSCKQIVDCLIESVLKSEANMNSEPAYKRLVACFTALHVLSKIKPENFINHAETLLPYLNIKSTVND